MVNTTLKERVILLGKQSSLEDIFDCMIQINSLIRGLRNYFGLSLPGDIATQLKQLDTYTSDLGVKFLPQKLQKETIWQLRERFSPQKQSTEALEDDKKQQMKFAGTGYPQESTEATVLPPSLQEEEKTEKGDMETKINRLLLHLFTGERKLSCHNSTNRVKQT